MDRILRKVRWRRTSASYEPLNGGHPDGDGIDRRQVESRISWTEYSIFVLLGISMLWAWNMFLAAAPYFQYRFASSDWLLIHFQSGILTVSTVTNLITMILLTNFQRYASYPKRIIASLILNFISFSLLALSTVFFRKVSAEVYFAFLMVTVFLSSLATGLCQNGLFAFVSGFDIPEYTQAIMTGQGISGVLPCIVQIVAVLSVTEKDADRAAGKESSTSALAYFLTATAVSVVSLLAFTVLARRHPDHSKMKQAAEMITEDEGRGPMRKEVGLWRLFSQMRWFASAIFLVFTITMVYPVFTQSILSVRPLGSASRIFEPTCFIPLGFLVWNTGDLIGRTIPLVPSLNLIHRPKTVLVASVLRVLFIPLYLLCNIRGRGAIISSDLFYLLVVQLFFGISSGYLGSTAMMGGPLSVDPDEREPAGGFMGLMLVGGLTTGSLLSFLAARA